MSVGKLRIGEIARRTGLSPTVLRAWENRYGLVSPERSPGGTRLYSAADLARVQTMQRHMSAGLSAAEAAAAALAASPAVVSDGSPASAADLNRLPAVADPGALVGQAVAPPGADSPELAEGARRLRDALIRLDVEGAERAIEALLGAFSFETLTTAVILPYLVDVGSRWARGEASIAEEHLATNVLRTRLLALTHGLGGARRGRVVLACPPEERHDLALVVFAVALSRRGWQITLLGADTPVETVADTARRVHADLVIVAAMVSERFDAVATELHALAAERRLMIAGPGATRHQAQQLSAELLESDPITAAAELERFAPAPLNAA